MMPPEGVPKVPTVPYLGNCHRYLRRINMMQSLGKGGAGGTVGAATDYGVSSVSIKGGGYRGDRRDLNSRLSQSQCDALPN